MARSILDTANEAYVAIDDRGQVTEWNLAAEQMFGYAREEMLGRDLAEAIIPRRYQAAHWEAVQRLIESETPFLGRRMELTGRHRDGHELPIELSVSFRRGGEYGSEQKLAFHAFLHDISARKLSEQVLVALQSVTRAMARANSPDQALHAVLATLGESMRWEVAVYWALDADGALSCATDWRSSDPIAEAFVAHSRQLRLSSGEGLPGRALARGESVWVSDFSSDTGLLRIQAARHAGLHAAICVPVVRGGAIVGVLEFLTSKPLVRVDSLAEAMATVGEQVGELLGILEDRQALLASLARLALTDQLTGLPNRRAWEEGLQRELARARRDGHPVCVAVIDLDEFKRYNDTHGHQAGDALLSATARAWAEQLRAGDILARYGGEEFAAAIPTRSLEAALLVVDRIRTHTPEGQTCSAGVASWDGSETEAELFARADRALYEAKQAGRDRTVGAR